MQIRSSLVLLTLAVTALSGCAQLEDFRVSAPAWESGFTWTYTTETEFAQGSDLDDGHDFEQEETLRVLRHSDVVDGAPFYLVEQRHDLAMDGMETPDGEFEEIDDWGWSTLLGVSSVDLSSYWIEDQVLYNCDGPPVCLDDLSTADGPDGWPFPALHFPLTDGKTWATQIDDVLELHAEVLGSAPAKTAAGDFEAIHVRLSGHMQEQDDWEGQTERFDVRITWDLYYSEQARIIVKDQLRGVGTIVEIDQEEGTSETHNIDVSTRRELTTFSLEPQPEMSADELWELLDGDDYVNRHLSIRQETYPDRGTGSVDVAFSASRYNLNDVSLQWIVRDGDGTQIADGVGDYFTAGLTYGGSYSIEAKALRNGTMLAEDTYWFALDEEVEETIDCGTRVAGLGNRCPDVEIPVRTGAYELHASAQAQGPLGGSGDLILIAPDGTEYDEAWVPLDSSQTGTWKARYSFDQGVEVSVDVEWTVYYDRYPTMLLH